jgi:teichoic acid transport system permease protein
VPLANSLLQLWLTGLGWAVVVGVLGFIYFWRGEKEYGRG